MGAKLQGRPSRLSGEICCSDTGKLRVPLGQRPMLGRHRIPGAKGPPSSQGALSFPDAIEVPPPIWRLTPFASGCHWCSYPSLGAHVPTSPTKIDSPMPCQVMGRMEYLPIDYYLGAPRGYPGAFWQVGCLVPHECTRAVAQGSDFLPVPIHP